MTLGIRVDGGAVIISQRAWFCVSVLEIVITLGIRVDRGAVIVSQRAWFAFQP